MFRYEFRFRAATSQTGALGMEINVLSLQKYGEYEIWVIDAES
jgi:hypothetical protein